jgi:hypothetical protein
MLAYRVEGEKEKASARSRKFWSGSEYIEHVITYYREGIHGDLGLSFCQGGYPII